MVKQSQPLHQAVLWANDHSIRGHHCLYEESAAPYFAISCFPETQTSLPASKGPPQTVGTGSSSFHFHAWELWFLNLGGKARHLRHLLKCVFLYLFLRVWLSGWRVEPQIFIVFLTRLSQYFQCQWYAHLTDMIHSIWKSSLPPVIAWLHS